MNLDLNRSRSVGAEAAFGFAGCGVKRVPVPVEVLRDSPEQMIRLLHRHHRPRRRCLENHRVTLRRSTLSTDLANS
jgi:hypothetical protein